MDKKKWRRLLGLVAAGVLAGVLAGCGGTGDTGPAGAPGGEGPPGPQGPPGPAGGAGVVNVASNASPSSDAAAAAWAALAPKVTIESVTIASPPVVKFTVTDANGLPIVGLEKSIRTTSRSPVPGYANVAFALAKLVPGADGSPSKWVSYMVTSLALVPDPADATKMIAKEVSPSRPGTDNAGTLEGDGNGGYTYTFFRDPTTVKDTVAALDSGSANKADLGDLTYDDTLVHRLTIQLSGDAPGTGSNTPNGTEVAGFPGVPMRKPVDAIYDFIPATGEAVAESGREIVAVAKCNECHRQLGGIPGDSEESSGAGFHGGSRNETRYCVVCHTAQRKYDRTEAAIDAATLTFTDSRTYLVDGRPVGDMPNNIHKIHMGKHLAKKGYNYADVEYNEVAFPQDVRNCTKCHDGSATSTAKTAQGDNWMTKPSRLACGACHDGINFATGKGVTLEDAFAGKVATTVYPGGLAHGGGAQPDDSLCALCHKPGAVDTYHLPVTPPSPRNALLAEVPGVEMTANTNAAWIASNTSRLPAGAIKVSYEIKSVSVNSAGQPVMVFRLLQDGIARRLKTFRPADPVADQEIWDNFMGSPSVYFVFAVPQDGIAEPADFNASASGYLRSLWNGTGTGTGAGTLTGPDDDRYYTATLTGVVIPASAKMLTGGVGYSYNVVRTLPLTQTNLADYPVAAATADPATLTPGLTNKTGGLIVITPNVEKVADGYTGRRPIVEDARCNACHQELGTFTEEAFHGGQRNNGQTCSWCHTPNRTSSAWSADSTSFIHAVHASAKRSVEFTWHAVAVGESFAEIKFPGVLRDCEACHLPGTYDFSATASADALPNRQYRTVGQGKYDATPAADPVDAYSISPYVIADAVTDYGSGFRFATDTGVTTEAAATTLVISPVTTACFACHDSAQARAHMEANQGSVYSPRGTALAKTESCMVCHGSGRIADIKVMHAK